MPIDGSSIATAICKIGQCDPQNWPGEIKGEKSHAIALRLRLSTVLPQNDSHLVAHFPGLFGTVR